jgi:superfamily II DNA or RNA helicase
MKLSKNVPMLAQLNGLSSELQKASRYCLGWKDLIEYCAGLSDKQKGDLFEELVKAYLLLDPEYATKLSHVWLHREVPAALRDELKLPDEDKGIDIIARTTKGEYWAIQCKYRTHTNQSLPWREISTFTGLAFGVCEKISFGLICSTTERITSVLKTQDRIGFCSLDVWQSLDSEFFTRLRTSFCRKQATIKASKPRPHQAAAIHDAHVHFVTKKEVRGKLIMPCGTGKSLTAYWIAQKLGARSILVAVPSLALIRQTLKVWLRESMANGQTVDPVCICSDESAGRIERDDVAVLKQDLGVPCLTSPSDIAKWLAKPNDGLTVVFATYQSGEAIAKAAKRANVNFDLGIMDEAHKTVGAKDKLFSHLLYEKNLPIRRRLFMTATERRYQGDSDQVLSMDDSSIYGETFHLLSYKRALEFKPPILSDYKIVTLLVSREEVAELVRKKAFLLPGKKQWGKEIEADTLAALIALRKAVKKYPIFHAVSFHSSIRRAEGFKVHNDAFTKAFPSYGHLETFHVSGQTPTGTRDRIIKDFAGTERGLITNARCLTEGIDVPDIDCVMFADPRRSAVDIVQAVGRALRPAKGKKMGYVIVPILHDATATTDEILDSGEFKQILTTLRALAANDDRIIDYFRSISEGSRRAGGGSVEFDLDERLAKRINLEHFVRDIDLCCWDRLAKMSWRPFEEARDFAKGLRLKSATEWQSYSKGECSSKGKLPPDIPSVPEQIYAGKGWKSYGDWLGTGTIATNLREYRQFDAARSFVRKLKLKNDHEWRVFCKGKLEGKGKLPPDIPSNPQNTYSGHGWKDLGDWLGTGTIATRMREYRPFLNARRYVHSLNLKNGTEWRDFCNGKFLGKGKLPSDIPVSPIQTYAGKGWKGMGDWLGTGYVANRQRDYKPFGEARTFAQSLKLKSGAEWKAFCMGQLSSKGKLPQDIPATPWQIYARKGWKGIGDWLGTGHIANQQREYRPFDKARTFVRKLKLKNDHEWRLFCKGMMPGKGKRPLDIPSSPKTIYLEKGWKGLGDWLGTEYVANSLRKYLPFGEAREFARNLNLNNGEEWSAFCKGKITSKGKLPSDIPSNPSTTYSDKGWLGMGDWLGTGTVAPRLRRYRPFDEARRFARSIKLRSTSEWWAFCKGKMPDKGTLPADIPVSPMQAYAAKGWKGVGDWLGTGTIATNDRKYRPFGDARAFAQSLKLKNGDEWRAFSKGKMLNKGKLPSDIPAHPVRTYATKGWKGMGDWLGTDSRK